MRNSLLSSGQILVSRRQTNMNSYTTINRLLLVLSGMATCKGWTKKGSLEEFWNGVHLEDEEREDLKIRGCRRLQEERERGELAT